jgi:hypothetical protein
VNVLDGLVSLLQPPTCKMLQQGSTNVGCQVTKGPGMSWHPQLRQHLLHTNVLLV